MFFNHTRLVNSYIRFLVFFFIIETAINLTGLNIALDSYRFVV